MAVRKLNKCLNKIIISRLIHSQKSQITNQAGLIRFCHSLRVKLSTTNYHPLFPPRAQHGGMNNLLINSKELLLNIPKSFLISLH
jgi:hypothetical protein